MKIYLALLWAFSIAIQPPTEDVVPKKISGRVLDYKSRRDKPVGIPGVIVEAFDEKMKQLAQALTDGKGSYTLEGLAFDKALTIHHRRIGYLRDPEVWQGVVGPEGVTVYMAKRNADQAYYREVGEAIVSRTELHEAFCMHLNNDLVCDVVPRTDKKALELEWRSFIALGVSPEERSIVRRSMEENTRGFYRPTDLLSIEAQVIASQISSLSPDEVATQYVYEEGFLADIYFYSNSAELSYDSEERLMATAQFLKASSFDLVIEGNTDERGTNELNMALSEKRASSVRDYLLRLGLEKSRITTISYGEQHPVCTEANESCYSKNRRVHLRLSSKK